MPREARERLPNCNTSSTSSRSELSSSVMGSSVSSSRPLPARKSRHRRRVSCAIHGRKAESSRGVSRRMKAREDVLEHVLRVLVAETEAANRNGVDVPRVALDELVPRCRVVRRHRRTSSASDRPSRRVTCTRSAAGIEQSGGDVVRDLLAGQGACEPRVVAADSEIDEHEVRGCPRATRCERGCSRGVGSIRAVASFRGQGRECRGVRAERGDLERPSGRFELLLERRNPADRLSSSLLRRPEAPRALLQAVPSALASSAARSPMTFACATTPSASVHDS